LRDLRRRLIGSYVVAISLLAVGAAVASVAAAASTAAASAKANLPPALVALEQKMRALHINSERGSVVEVLTGVPLGGKGLLKPMSSKPSRHGGKHTVVRLTTHPRQSFPFLTADFETSVVPKLTIVRGDIFGTISFQERVIGEQAYTRLSLFAQLDGGKPWIYVSPAELAEEKAQKSAEGGSAPVSPGAQSVESGFGKLIETIEHARSVSEVGPKEVDGQQTTEFEAKLNGGQLAGASSASKISKAAKKALGRSTLELFLAEDGLPVRTRIQTWVGKAGVSIVQDILATEIPVSVEPPPASETITEAELKEHEEKSLEVHLTKRERKELRRFEACVRRHRPKGARAVTRREGKKILRECPPPRD
jgi:hypothetical protein